MYKKASLRHTRKELCRYNHETINTMSECEHVTLAGPDETKIGDKLAIGMAVIGDSQSKKIAICPPQVCCPYCAT